MPESALEALRHAIPELKLADDPSTVSSYARDWTRLHQPRALAVAFPGDVDQVQAIVRFANDNALALVPSGGRTGLSGGAIACQGELVVSLELMSGIIEFDPIDQSVTVEAGLITQNLQEFAAEKGLFFPIDFASRGSSQIGGNLATNAGGIKVLRYGLMRDWVTGLKVVTASGELLELNQGLVKNATGYDLRHLFVGSEGTLGIIVEATLRLTRPPVAQQVMVLAVEAAENLMDVMAVMRSRLGLSAFEFFSELALQKVLAGGHLRRPFETEAPYYALLEYDCRDEADEALALAAFEHCAEAGWAVDGVISQSESQARELWRLREDISESLASFTPYKNDISVRPSRVARFLERLEAIVTEHYPAFEVIWFGHIGDGNLHLNVLKPKSLSVTEFATACERVNRLVFELVGELQGSISAEHGVGLLKKPYLEITRSPKEIEFMRDIKHQFDPNNILNPGKLIN
jgi:FAD/FMN-containing dehydrogenase